MKLQGMTIVYVLIILPIFFVVSIVISTQIQIINARLDYDKKVLGAAQDAIKSFEINTANEEFSKVSDVLRSIVEASVNVFKDSLGTKLGMSNVSKQYIDTFFPLSVFTLYDGYYITSPINEPVTENNSKGNAIHIDDPEAQSYTVNQNNTEVTNVNIDKTKTSTGTQITRGAISGTQKFSGTNSYKPIVFETPEGGNKYTTDAEKAKTKTRHVLKNYIPYSSRYKLNGSGSDYIFINYTIDNYIAIYGKKNNMTFNKAGYLLDKNTTATLTNATSSNILSKFVNLNADSGTDKQIDELIDEARKVPGTKIVLKVQNEQIVRRSSQENVRQKIVDTTDLNDIVYDYADDVPESQKPKKSTYANGANGGDEGYLVALNDYKSKRAYADQQINAIKYYLKAVRFSKWVYDNFSSLKENDIIEDQATETIVKKFPDYFESNKTDKQIFGGKVLEGDSTFNEHKRKVIKNNIQYNLIMAAINYNRQKFGDNPEFKMPRITEPDWEKIIERISFVVFAEGLRSK